MSAVGRGGSSSQVRAVVGQRDSEVIAEGFEDIDAARMAWLNNYLRRQPKTNMSSELIGDTKPGFCISCDMPLPPAKSSGFQRQMHDTRECRRVYERAYYALRRSHPKPLKTHCKLGHELPPPGTRDRRCLICKKDYRKQYNAAAYKKLRGAK